jgi:hypothetical protein
MANRLYDAAAQRFATGNLDWTAGTFKAVLVDTGAYAVNIATHDFLSDIAGGARIAISATLTGLTASGGACDADNTLFAAVSGVQSEAVVIFEDSGVDSTSALIAYIDTAPGLPITPNGGDIILNWDNGVDKIFKV